MCFNWMVEEDMDWVITGRTKRPLKAELLSVSADGQIPESWFTPEPCSKGEIAAPSKMRTGK